MKEGDESCISNAPLHMKQDTNRTVEKRQTDRQTDRPFTLLLPHGLGIGLIRLYVPEAARPLKMLPID